MLKFPHCGWIDLTFLTYHCTSSFKRFLDFCWKLSARFLSQISLKTFSDSRNNCSLTLRWRFLLESSEFWTLKLFSFVLWTLSHIFIEENHYFSQYLLHFFTFFLIILFKVFKASLKWRRRFAKIIWIFGLNLGLNRSINTVTRFYREKSNFLVQNHFFFQFFLQQKLVERLYLAWFSLQRVEMTDRIFFWKSLVFSQNSIELEQTRTYERKLKSMKISKHIFEIDWQKVLILCLKIYFLRKSTSQLKIILRVAAQSWKNSKTIYFREWIFTLKFACNFVKLRL